MTKDTPTAHPPMPWDWMAAWNHPAAFAHTREAWLKACADWQQEAARIVAARLEQGRQLQESLSACRDLGDALRIQQDWAFSTIKQCGAEASRLAEIASSVMQGEAVETKKQAPAPEAQHGLRAAE